MYNLASRSHSELVVCSSLKDLHMSTYVFFAVNLQEWKTGKLIWISVELRSLQTHDWLQLTKQEVSFVWYVGTVSLIPKLSPHANEKATENWAGPGNKANVLLDTFNRSLNLFFNIITCWLDRYLSNYRIPLQPRTVCQYFRNLQTVPLQITTERPRRKPNKQKLEVKEWKTGWVDLHSQTSPTGLPAHWTYGSLQGVWSATNLHKAGPPHRHSAITFYAVPATSWIRVDWHYCRRAILIAGDGGGIFSKKNTCTISESFWIVNVSVFHSSSLPGLWWSTCMVSELYQQDSVLEMMSAAATPFS